MTTAKREKANRPAAKGRAVKKAKKLIPKIAAAKAADAEPPAKTVSTKAHPRAAALKQAKKPAGLKPATKASRDTAAAKQRDHALTGRSQLNFRG